MMKMVWVSLICLLGCAQVQAQVLAFPTAEGFGRFASGGRGGTVCKVTNLNDTGTGSLRACLNQSSRRTIVFNVSGRIVIDTAITTIPKDLTLACQTAPGQGVVINGNLKFWNTQNLIIRHCRFAAGPPPPGGYNNLITLAQATASNSIIVDHSSFRWSSDDMLGVANNTTAVTQNVTIQNSIFMESLITGPGSGGAIWLGGPGSSTTNLSVIHNIFANQLKRTPHPQGGTLQIVNNVISNARQTSIYLLAKYAPVIANVVNNWMTPSNQGGVSNIQTVGCGHAGYTCNAAREIASRLYLKGNVHTSRRPSAGAGSETAMLDQSGYAYAVQSTTPNPGFPTITSMLSAVDAKAYALAHAGARVPYLDAVDQKAVADVTNGIGRQCGTGVTVASCVVWPIYASGTVLPDPDNDGIPSAWESSHGLDPANGLDGKAISANGESNLGNYLNELAGDLVFPSSLTTPIARYLFDNNTNDSVGAFHATPFNAPTYASGKFDQAINLDGVNQYAKVTHATALNFGSAATISAWVKMDTLNPSTGDTVVMKGNWNTSNAYMLVFYSNQLRCGIGTIWSSALTYPSASFDTDRWYHLACQADSTGHRLYINGAVMASNTTPKGAVTATTDLFIGSYFNPAVGLFDGQIDDLRLYSTNLSGEEITQLASGPEDEGPGLPISCTVQSYQKFIQ